MYISYIVHYITTQNNTCYIRTCLTVPKHHRISMVDQEDIGILQEDAGTAARRGGPTKVGSDGALDQLRHQQSESQFRGSKKKKTSSDWRYLW